MSFIQLLLICFFIIIVIINIIVLYKVYRSQYRIPKIIWTYWDGDIPLIVQKCINTWKKHNPDHKIIILNNDTIPSFIKEIKHAQNDPTRRSDYVRLYVLNQYGGIWMDSTIICNAPLPIDYNNEFEGYYINAYTIPELKECSPVIESWFIACRRNNEFIKAWYEEFMRTSKYDTIDGYLESINNEGIQHNINIPEYLTIHISAQAVLQRETCNKYKLNLKKAEDTAFKYLVDNNWDSEKALDALSEDKYIDQPIIKLRGDERKLFEKKFMK